MKNRFAATNAKQSRFFSPHTFSFFFFSFFVFHPVAKNKRAALWKQIRSGRLRLDTVGGGKTENLQIRGDGGRGPAARGQRSVSLLPGAPVSSYHLTRHLHLPQISMLTVLPVPDPSLPPPHPPTMTHRLVRPDGRPAGTPHMFHTENAKHPALGSTSELLLLLHIWPADVAKLGDEGGGRGGGRGVTKCEDYLKKKKLYSSACVPGRWCTLRLECVCVCVSVSASVFAC